jgi:hypothetical protein
VSVTGLRALGLIHQGGGMRAASSVRRTAARAIAATVAAALMLAGAGCGSLAQAQQVAGRADLVNDLAARLTAAGELSYSADYQLPAGGHASITQGQQPPRTAYAYPDGRLIVTVDATTECHTAGKVTTCTLTAPPVPGASPAAKLFTATGKVGLVPPSVVVGLLTTAALDPDAVIEQRDTTIAGEHATCVTVRGVDNAQASRFDTCITTVGVLGSFSAELNGTHVDLTMTSYRDAIDPAAFAVPAGATVVDHRPGAK